MIYVAGLRKPMGNYAKAAKPFPITHDLLSSCHGVSKGENQNIHSQRIQNSSTVSFLRWDLAMIPQILGDRTILLKPCFWQLTNHDL
jgi:hypothetical protein